MDFVVFVMPVLTPVLHHHGLSWFFVVALEVHHQNMLETDEIIFIFYNVDVLGAPGLIRSSDNFTINP